MHVHDSVYLLNLDVHSIWKQNKIWNFTIMEFLNDGDMVKIVTNFT